MTDGSWFSPTDTANPRAHGDLLSLDPSVRSPGVALFRDGILVKCARVKIPAELHKMPEGQRWLRVAQEISAWWADQPGGRAITTVAYELPQLYVDSKSLGDKNKLLGLVGVGQSLAVHISCWNAANRLRAPEIVTPQPDEWTGQVPKTIGGKIPVDPWTSPRGIRVKARLQPGELAVVPAQHDAIDALGVGLWCLGRYEARRVFSGAT